MAQRRQAGTLRRGEGNFENKTEALIAAVTTPLSEATKRAINRIVNRLNAEATIARLDTLYFYCMLESDADARLNWINPATFQCSKVNSPTFDLHVGFQCARTGNKYLDTGYNVLNGGGHMAQDDMSLWFYSETAAQDTGSANPDDMGAGSQLGVGAYTSAGMVSTRHNTGSNNTQANVGGTGKGFFGMSAPNVANTSYFNCQELVRTSKNATPLASVNATIRIGDRNGTGSDRKFSCAATGQSLSQTQMEILREAMLMARTYREIV